MEATAKLARFIVETGYEHMPVAAIVSAKNAFLDTLGVALAGSREPAAKIITGLIRNLGGEPRAGIIGESMRTNASHAGWANAIMAHALDYDDDIGVGYGHPSTVIVPAVLALGEELGSSGRDVIEAYVLGVEAWFKVARTMPRLHTLGWHPTGVFGALGAAAAAAKLLKLDVAQTLMALGLAGSQSAGMTQNLGTMTKPFHAGNAARSGIIAAMLAKEGYTATRSILEGELGFAAALCGAGKVDVSKMVDKLGAPFAVVSPGINVKNYPCFYSAHKSIDAMLHLIAKHGITPEDVAAVDCRVPARITKVLFYTEPGTELEAKFSMQFFMAAALADRKLGLAQFTEARVSDPVIRGLMKKVTMCVHEGIDNHDAPEPPDVVTVTLNDGRRLSHAVNTARGHADTPLSTEALREKFRDCAGLVRNEGDVNRLIELLAKLEELEDLERLMVILTGRGMS